MLIAFTVENYRSIKEPVTLSAVAQMRPKRQGTGRHAVTPDEEIAAPYPVEGRRFELLPVIGIFGANASGKSNVLTGLDDFLTFGVFGAGDKNALIRGLVPFRLSPSSSAAPTRFELRAAVGQSLYVYSLHADQERIIFERLEQTPPPPKRSRLLFERRWSESDNKPQWKNGAEFAGPHIQLQPLLQPQEPFLHLLVKQLDVESVREFARWLRERWAGVALGFEQHDADLAMLIGRYSPAFQAAATSLVRRFDTGVSDIHILTRHAEDADEHRVVVAHKTDTGDVQWGLEEESAGTQRLYSLAYRILHAFGRGTPVIIDELGSSIHPNIAREIVRLFQSPQTNPRRAQLIFSSHDNTLQRGNLLRRDQIWFTQKRSDGSTDLYPLSDFHPRNDLAIDRAYLDGRFGAVPVLPDELLPIEEAA